MDGTSVACLVEISVLYFLVAIASGIESTNYLRSMCVIYVQIRSKQARGGEITMDTLYAYFGVDARFIVQN